MASNKIELYNNLWDATNSPLAIEMHMVRKGGRYRKKDGGFCGNGIEFHFRRMEELMYGDAKIWHRWNIKQLELYLHHRTIGVIGPASSGKTNSGSTDVLADYLCFSDQTTGLFCSTTRERLEDRVWGEVKKYFKIAKSRWPWLPGYLIEGRQRIITDSRHEASEGRDFRNGLIGVPCKRGADYVGLGDFIGIKNKRVRVVADELHLLPRVFVDMISNLDKNPDLKVIGLGNPKDTTDALGVLCEPSANLGGWDGGIDQTPGTKHWEIRRPNGVCLQLPGSDSPNLDGNMSIPLITQEQIDRDVAFYGKESLWFTMMNEGRMPRGQGARRVLTRQLCQKFHAMDPPNWMNSMRTVIAFLDAAYRGVGGDRCIFGLIEFGEENRPPEPDTLLLSSILNQGHRPKGKRDILALVEIANVPIKAASGEPAEDQIVNYVKNRCMAMNIPPDNFFFDAGMRTSLVTAFARLWSPNVESIDCGGKPSERNVSADISVKACDYYSKFITELWFAIRHVVESGQFRGMTEEALGEFSAREWTVVGANKIEVEPKAKMKEKTGRSPDIADAIAIGVHGAVKRGFVIARLRPPEKNNIYSKWKDELRKRADNLRKSKQLVHS